MTTDEIVNTIKLAGKLMDLHGENTFKVQSFAKAAFKLDKTDGDLTKMNLKELEGLDGVGKGIAKFIFELNEKGEAKELNELLSKTPAGVIDMMSIKGIGPKKVATLWKDLKIESVGDLLAACRENRLVEVKGFGEKTQDLVKKGIEFKMASAGKLHYSRALAISSQIVEELKKQAKPGDKISFTGEIRRRCEIVNEIEILVDEGVNLDLSSVEKENGIKIKVITCPKEEFAFQLLETTSSPEHLKKLGKLKFDASLDSEEKIYKSLDMQYILPELREGMNEIDLAKKNKIPKLIEEKDLKGILHNHSKYSDGLHSLKDMAVHCKELGYQYLGMCDHSRSAFYANGLHPDRVMQQSDEIDTLNEQLAPFKIFKGIESDILNDGSLDYPKEILKTFDLIVASVHSNLKMDKEKATHRLIKAIENPYTTILGHPTGRLLLFREGYPIDHKKVIDACAANGVVMELNANPYRLDIDWRWIHYCLEKNVMVSINPDAHEKDGYNDMFFGICVARKGMLTKEMCFNALTLSEMENYLAKRKKK